MHISWRGWLPGAMSQGTLPPMAIAADKKDLVPLHSTAALVVKEFRVVHDQLQMEPELFNGWCGKISGLPPADRPLVGQGLIAMALRLQREAPATSSIAITQLSQLAALALGADKVAAALGKDVLERAPLPNLGGGIRALPASVGSRPQPGTVNAAQLSAQMRQPLGARGPINKR